MQTDRSGSHSLSFPHLLRERRRAAALSFDLSDLSELIAYLRPGASFHLAGHLCEALFPGSTELPADVVARCRGWAGDRHCIPCRSRQDDGIDFRKV